MGFFSFENDFEIVLNHPKSEVYEKFVSQIREKRWRIGFTKPSEKICFQTNFSLLSWPINFNVTFTDKDKKNTILSVHASADHLDMGRSKGIINDIIKEIY